MGPFLLTTVRVGAGPWARVEDYLDGWTVCAVVSVARRWRWAIHVVTAG